MAGNPLVYEDCNGTGTKALTFDVDWQPTCLRGLQLQNIRNL